MVDLIPSLAFIFLFVVFAIILICAEVKRKSDPGEGFGSFAPRPLLNRFERQLLPLLDSAASKAFGPQARIFTQVSYGEFLRGEDRSAHARINQKRADFVVVDGQAKVLCVIEYQGSGHYGRGQKAHDDAAYRDKVKRMACKSASIAFVEIPAKFSAETVDEALAATVPRDVSPAG